MSNLAFAPAPERASQSPRPRRVEVVATRAQRRARPSIVYSLVTVASLFVIFAAQLLLSIVVSDGAYQIAALQAEQKELLREQQALTEQLDVLGSSQYLAANAANLGMVPAGSPLFLDVSTGGVAAAPGTVDRVGCGGSCNLVANLLTHGKPLVQPAPPPATSVATTVSNGGATEVGAGTATPPDSKTPTGAVDAIPAPSTH